MRLYAVADPEEQIWPWLPTQFGYRLYPSPGHILSRIYKCTKPGNQPIDNAATGHFTLQISILQLRKLWSTTAGSLCNKIGAGVTDQRIPPAGVYPGLKRPWLDYTRVYYELGQFIPRGILWPRPIHTPQAKLYLHDINHDLNSVERYTQELSIFSTNYWGFSFVRYM